MLVRSTCVCLEEKKMYGACLCVVYVTEFNFVLLILPPSLLFKGCACYFSNATLDHFHPLHSLLPCASSALERCLAVTTMVLAPEVEGKHTKYFPNCCISVNPYPLLPF